jgi:drug/metabolite transporter (DMT)-like permease
MNEIHRTLALGLAVSIPGLSPAAWSSADAPAKLSFNEHIQPILSEYCYHCHGLAAGALNSFGVSAAYRYDGKAAIVTTLAAAIQPLVTIVLALIFLGEKVGLIESAGIAVAKLAAVALSAESKPTVAAPPH